MMSKKNFGKRGQSSRKNPFVDKTCFQCGEVSHIIVNCLNKKNNKNKKEKKKMKEEEEVHQEKEEWPNLFC